MARSLLMSWVPASRRWAKQYRGRPYAVSCHQLGVPETKEASWRAANKWWIDKQKELDAANPPKKIHPHQATINSISEKIDWANTHAPAEVPQLQAVLNETQQTPEDFDAPRDDLRVIARRVAQFERLFGVELPQDADPDLLAEFFGNSRVWSDRLERQPAPVSTDNTLRNGADEYLVVMRKKEPGTYGDRRTQVENFISAPGVTTPGMPISNINEDLWRKYYLHLDLKREREELSETTCKNRMVGARAFVSYLYRGGKLSALPRNLNDNSLAFTAVVKKIEVPKVEWVQDTLIAAADTRMGCYLMLMLNCGMTQVDIANLSPDMIDWDNKTITRKRIKTKKRKSVPTVTYKLWDRTLQLLSKHNSERDDFVLVSEAGTKLMTKKLKGEKDSKTDLINLMWQRWKQKPHKMQLKSLRQLSPTLLQGHPEFGRYAQFFLGQAPTSVADKHYVVPSQERFDAAVQWLGVMLTKKQVEG